MALKKVEVIDQISADEYGNVSVRTRSDIIEDKVVVSSTYHRKVLGPKDDVSTEDDRVQLITRAARKGALPLPKAD